MVKMPGTTRPRELLRVTVSGKNQRRSIIRSDHTYQTKFWFATRAKARRSTGRVKQPLSGCDSAAAFAAVIVKRPVPARRACMNRNVNYNVVNNGTTNNWRNNKETTRRT